MSVEASNRMNVFPRQDDGQSQIQCETVTLQFNAQGQRSSGTKNDAESRRTSPLRSTKVSRKLETITGLESDARNAKHPTRSRPPKTNKVGSTIGRSKTTRPSSSGIVYEMLRNKAKSTSANRIIEETRRLLDKSTAASRDKKMKIDTDPFFYDNCYGNDFQSYSRNPVIQNKKRVLHFAHDLEEWEDCGTWNTANETRNEFFDDFFRIDQTVDCIRETPPSESMSIPPIQSSKRSFDEIISSNRHDEWHLLSNERIATKPSVSDGSVNTCPARVEDSPARLQLPINGRPGSNQEEIQLENVGARVLVTFTTQNENQHRSRCDSFDELSVSRTIPPECGSSRDVSSVPSRDESAASLAQHQNTDTQINFQQSDEQGHEKIAEEEKSSNKESEKDTRPTVERVPCNTPISDNARSSLNNPIPAENLTRIIDWINEKSEGGASIGSSVDAQINNLNSALDEWWKTVKTSDQDSNFAGDLDSNLMVALTSLTIAATHLDRSPLEVDKETNGSNANYVTEEISGADGIVPLSKDLHHLAEDDRIVEALRSIFDLAHSLNLPTNDEAANVGDLSSHQKTDESSTSPIPHAACQQIGNAEEIIPTACISGQSLETLEFLQNGLDSAIGFNESERNSNMIQNGMRSMNNEDIQTEEEGLPNDALNAQKLTRQGEMGSQKEKFEADFAEKSTDKTNRSQESVNSDSSTSIHQSIGCSMREILDIQKIADTVNMQTENLARNFSASGILACREEQSEARNDVHEKLEVQASECRCEQDRSENNCTSNDKDIREDSFVQNRIDRKNLPALRRPFPSTKENRLNLRERHVDSILHPNEVPQESSTSNLQDRDLYRQKMKWFSVRRLRNSLHRQRKKNLKTRSYRMNENEDMSLLKPTLAKKKSVRFSETLTEVHTFEAQESDDESQNLFNYYFNLLISREENWSDDDEYSDDHSDSLGKGNACFGDCATFHGDFSKHTFGDEESFSNSSFDDLIN